MPVNLQPVVIPSVLPVGPWRATLARQFFALHLSTGVYDESPAGHQVLPASERLPWDWEADDDSKFVVIAERAGAPGTYDLFGVRLFTQPATPHFKDEGEVTLGVIKTRWVNREANAAWNPTFVGEDRRVEATLPEQLAYLSTFPGDLPQQLKLVRYFRLRPLGADGRSGKNGLIESTEMIGSFVVAPVVRGDAPVETFRFNEPTDGRPNWQDGWPYASGARSAFVKPVRVGRGGQHLDFSDDGNTPERLRFDSYWPRNTASRPWTDGLERRCAEIFNAFVRLSEVEPEAAPNLPEDAPENTAAGEFAEALEALRLKALAFNSHWPRPTDPAAGGAPNDSDRLIDELAELLGPGPALAPALRAKLTLLFDRLTGAAAEDNKQLWVEMMARNLGVASRPGEIFSKLHESRELLSRLLFFQWSPLFRLPDFKAPAGGAAGEFFVAEAGAAWDALPEESRQDGGASRADVVALFEDYVRRTQRGRADAFVAPILASAKTAEQLSEGIVAGAKGALLKLCEEVNKVGLPRLEEKTVCAGETWARYADDYAESLREQLKTGPDETERQSKPGGLTIQFDEPAHEGRPQVEDPDAWRNIAGVVPMLREPGKPWFILSAANIHEKGGAAVETPDDLAGETPEVLRALAGLFDKPALVPVRVPFRDGVRYPFLTYDQRSLVAASPLSTAALGGGRFEFHGDRRDPLSPSLLTDSKYEYRAVLQKTFGQLRLARLRFGRTYEAAAFIMDTAGGIPDALAATATDVDENGAGVSVPLPWSFDYSRWEGAAPQQNFDVPAHARVTFDYLRRVPVGQVRVTPLRGGLQSWPEPPAGVFPLAKEIEGAGGESAQGVPRPGEERTIQAAPLALLYGGPQTSRVTLNLRPPTVDTDVLERWLDTATAEGRAHLGRVLAEYFERLSRRSDQTLAPSKPADDLSLDDPATGALLLTLETYEFDPAAGRPGWSLKGHHLIEPPQAGQGIARHQWRGVDVVCERGAGKSESADEGGGVYRVTVASDHATVARVSVYALVSRELTADGAKRMFPKHFFLPGDAQKPERNEDVAAELAEDYDELLPITDAFHCLRPFRVLLETPTDAMPAPEDLWRQMRLARIADRERWNGEALHRTKSHDREAVAVCLVTMPELLRKDPTFHKPPPLAQAPGKAFRNVITCDVLKQTWRWQGRPVNTKVSWLSDGRTERDGEVMGEVLEWEVAAFAEMDDLFDTTAFPVSYKHGSPEPLLIDGYDKDPRAYYVRYAVRAHSRYKPLFTSLATPVTSRQLLKLKEALPDNTTVVRETPVSGVGWRRALVPYRGPKPPRPVVKAVVPLSQAAGEGETVAPLLVVLDETMFSFCGITESVECEIELAQLPKDLNPAEHRLFQVGPDPLLSTGTYVEKLKTIRRLVLRCEDPFGYTFDSDARQPFFSSTSLTLKPEFKHGAKDDSLASWDMARIRFRRLSHLPAEGDAGGAEDEWTKPTWVQFTPAASFGLSWATATAARRSAGPAGGATSVVLKVGGDGVEQLFNPEGGRLFQHWLLLTKSVRDFRGFREREHYVATVRAAVREEGGAALIEARLPEKEKDGELRCRLMEVQVTPKDSPSGDDPWADLLGGGGESAAAADPEAKDAKGRVTRISPVVVLKSGGGS